MPENAPEPYGDFSKAWDSSANQDSLLSLLRADVAGRQQAWAAIVGAVVSVGVGFIAAFVTLGIADVTNSHHRGEGYGFLVGAVVEAACVVFAVVWYHLKLKKSDPQGLVTEATETGKDLERKILQQQREVWRAPSFSGPPASPRRAELCEVEDRKVEGPS